VAEGTIVFQSAPAGARSGWRGRCLQSVEAWAAARGAVWRLLDDRFLDPVPDWYRAKTADRLPVQADLARLIEARRLLDAGWRRVVWLDADTLVFAPEGLRLDGLGPAGFGVEHWVQADARGRWRVRRNVHNAFCVFEAGNSALDFLIDTVLSIVRRHDGPPAPQLVGPKLLGALQPLAGFPVSEAVGAFSPPVIADIAAGGGPALDALRRAPLHPPAAANLAASLIGRETDGATLTDTLLERAVDRLLGEGLPG